MEGGVEEARQWIQRAEQTTLAARDLVSTGHFPDAVSRAYYAMFYAARAAVLTEGVQVSRHQGVISAFGRLFAKTGRLPSDLHHSLISAFDRRQGADYSLARETTKEDAEMVVEQAERFVAVVSRSLSLDT